MIRRLAAFILAFVAVTALAEQPSRDQVTRPLYLLGSHRFANAATDFSGILRYDIATKSFAPFASLQWGNYPGLPVGGATALAATADRIVVQGADYIELDAASGRLLRRYESNDFSNALVAFHGTIVTEEQARVLGIPSGTYGSPSCTWVGLSSPTFTGCIEWSTRSNEFSLMRRSLDPTDVTLTAVKAVQAFAIVLDPPHRQFWLLGLQPHWLTMSINDRGIGEPNPTNILAPNALMSVTYHSPTQSIFELFQPATNTKTLQQQSTNDATIVTSDMQPSITAMTAVSDPLPDRYVQVIPAIGETAGANGTFWHSDVWLYNPSTDPIDVTLRRVARPQMTTTQHLAAHASVAMRDVLKTLGGGPSGDGVTIDALVIDAPYRWGAQLVAYSRTYTSGADGGTYGQSVPAVPSSVGYSNHVHDFRTARDVVGYPSSILLDKREPSRYRHNLGVVNDSDSAFDIRLFGGDITEDPSFGVQPPGTVSVTIAAHSVRTVNLEALFTNPDVVMFAADRAAPVWLSMIDNLSGDATFVPFTNFATNGASEGEMAIPAVGTTRGTAGTSWRTDLYGRFRTVVAGETPAHPLAHLDASSGCTADFRFTGDGPFIFRDVAHQFAACDPGSGVTGALRMRGNSWMQGFSRTYTTRADGGTLGDMLPFYPQNGWPLQHFSGIDAGARFRINVGLYNGQSTTTTNRLLLYDANGTLVAQRDIDIAPHASMQSPIAALMNLASLPAGLYGLTVIPQGEGRSWAYVSLVDNISGDPTNLW